MFYVVDKRNRTAFAAQLDEMYRIRYRIYVEQRKWMALSRADKREIDPFDTEEAVYLLGLDEAGLVTSGLRLVPTTGPTLMRDVFSHALTWGRIPCDERILEMSRHFLTSEPADYAQQWHMESESLCAMFEYGLAAGLKRVSLLCDAYYLRTLLECGWNVHPLGVPTPYGEGTCIAILFEVTEAALVGTRASRGVFSPVLTFSPYPPPFAETDYCALAPRDFRKEAARG